MLTNLPKDYDIRLYNSAGTQLKISENGGTDSETIVYNSTVAATYCIQVYGFLWASSNTVCYQLRINTAGSAFIGNTVDAPAITFIKDQPDKKKMVIYPNPVRDALTINFEAEESTRKDVVVLDIMGRIVYTKMMMAQKGFNTLQLSLPNLSPGVYFLKMGDNKVQRFAVAK